MTCKVCGSYHELEALGVAGRCAVTLVHVAAPYPFGSWCHSYLVGSSIRAYCTPCGVRAVEVVVTGLL